MDSEGKGKQTITVSLDELDQRIQHDLQVHEHMHRAEESTREKVEGYLYLFCLVMGAAFIIIHAFTDWVPFLVGLPSARVILTRFL